MTLSIARAREDGQLFLDLAWDGEASCFKNVIEAVIRHLGNDLGHDPIQGLLTTFDLRAQELHRGILWNAEWVRRFRVAIELGKSGGVVLKVLLKGLDASSTGRMVGKKLRNLSHISIFKILKQPR